MLTVYLYGVTDEYSKYNFSNIKMMDFIKKILGKREQETLKEILKGDVFLVDVRSPDEFASGTVVGAVNIPLGLITDQLTRFDAKKRIVVFCRSGMRSAQAKGILEKAGYSGVVNGGAWQKVQSELK